MAWNGVHRAFVVEQFIRSGDSVIATQRAFRNQFDVGRHGAVPDGRTIRRWVLHFRETGSALKRKSTGRPRTVRTPENVNAVRVSVQQSPRRSARRHAAALGISDRSVRRILHKSLEMYPYKMMLVQELNERDFQTRTNACRDILQNIPRGAVFMSSDEAHFHLSGSVNKQNFRFWSATNPQELHERPLHSPKVTVWCAISELGVWGPYFFEEDGLTVTVNGDRYLDMLNNFLRPQLNNLNDNQRENLWFQQDGATSHTTRRALNLLQEMFPNKVVSLRGDIGWPPRSPDLSPCDYFLWGYLKSRVFTHRPRTLEELRAAIRQEIAAIPQDMIRRVMTRFRENLQQCINNNGRHLRDIIFKQ